MLREKPKKRSPYYWLAEPLLEQDSVVEKRMFGCDAFYLFGRLQLVLCDGEAEPWRGILLATDKAQHAALQIEFPLLKPHEVLGKWLYLAEDHDDFEMVAQRLVQRIASDDPRIGVEPEANRPNGRRRKKKLKSK